MPPLTTPHVATLASQFAARTLLVHGQVAFPLLPVFSTKAVRTLELPPTPLQMMRPLPKLESMGPLCEGCSMPQPLHRVLVPEDLLFLIHPLKMSCHEIGVSQRRSQHLDTLLCSGNVRAPMADGCWTLSILSSTLHARLMPARFQIWSFPHGLGCKSGSTNSLARQHTLSQLRVAL